MNKASRKLDGDLLDALCAMEEVIEKLNRAINDGKYNGGWNADNLANFADSLEAMHYRGEQGEAVPRVQ